MSVSRQVTVGVTGDAQAPSTDSLFSTQAAVFPVQFPFCTIATPNHQHPLILSGQDQRIPHRVTTAGLPVYVAPSAQSTPASAHKITSHLGKSATFDASMRGFHFLEEQDSESVDALLVSAGNEVIASQAGDRNRLPGHFHGRKRNAAISSQNGHKSLRE